MYLLVSALLMSWLCILFAGLCSINVMVIYLLVSVLLYLPFGVVVWSVVCCCHWQIQRGGGVRTSPLKNHKYMVCYPTCPDPLATKPAFYVWPSLARQRNGICMAFRWRADDGPFIAIFGFSIPSST